MKVRSIRPHRAVRLGPQPFAIALHHLGPMGCAAGRKGVIGVNIPPLARHRSGDTAVIEIFGLAKVILDDQADDAAALSISVRRM